MAVIELNLPPNVWTNVYAATGIPVGTSLVLDTYLNTNIDVDDTVAIPTNTIGFPLGKSRESDSAILTAGSVGAWARSAVKDASAILIVQLNS